MLTSPPPFASLLAGLFIRAIGVALIGPALILLVSHESPSAHPAPVPAVSTIPQQVIELTNRMRARAGLAPLTESAQLNAAAGAQARAIATLGFFDHINPRTKSDPGDRATTAGYAWVFVAENLAEGPVTPAEVVRDWMDSPVHRANILSPEPRDIGVAYVRDPRSANRCGSKPCTHFWTQVFGRR